MSKKFEIEGNPDKELKIYINYPNGFCMQIGHATLDTDQETYRISGMINNLTITELYDFYLEILDYQLNKWREEERMILQERRNKNERD